MTSAFEHFTERIGRLTQQANDLRIEKTRNEGKIELIQARQGEIHTLLANIEANVKVRYIHVLISGTHVVSER